MPRGLTVMPSSRIVQYNDDGLQVGVMVLSDDDTSTRIALTWDNSTAAHLDLSLAFQVPSSGTMCEVSEARPACGGGSMETGPLVGAALRPPLWRTPASSAVAFEELPQTSISVFLTADMPRCFGYGLASSSDLPGGRDGSLPRFHASPPHLAFAPRGSLTGPAIQSPCCPCWPNQLMHVSFDGRWR